MKRMHLCSKFMSCLITITFLTVFFAGCGVENTPECIESTERIQAEAAAPADMPETYPPDFCEKPAAEEGFVHSYPLGTTVRYDLNGDGVGEDIFVDAQEYSDGKLIVGNAQMGYGAICPTGYFTILNVDRNSNELLIGVSDYGFSDDPMTVLYTYDGAQLREVGYYEDITGKNTWELSGAICNGDGTITAKARFDILGTWQAWALYRVESGMLKDITDFYDYAGWEEQPDGWNVSTRMDVIMFTDVRDNGTQTVVPAGTKLTMTGVQKGDRDGAYWACFRAEWAEADLWMAAELVEWYTIVPAADGWVSSEEAFDGFFYAG